MKKLVPVCLFMFIALMAKAQSPDKAGAWSKKDAAAWYNKFEWMKGVKPKPHASVNRQEFARLYHLHPERWERAFAYLKNTDLTALKPGRFQVWGDSVYVTVTESASKDSALTRWEGHKNYADIHYMITGKEKIGVGPLMGAKNIVPYDETKDIGFYETQGKFYEASNKVFFIFFPNLDAHRPGVKVTDGGTEKKLVIKILTEK